jgi:hypothetical protein
MKLDESVVLDSINKQITICEGGINWNWFTDLTLLNNGKVKVHKHYRLHKYEEEEVKKSYEHPAFYNSSIWKETDERTAVAYCLPGLGWCEIENKKYVFDYQ